MQYLYLLKEGYVLFSFYTRYINMYIFHHIVHLCIHIINNIEEDVDSILMLSCMIFDFAKYIVPAFKTNEASVTISPLYFKYLNTVDIGLLGSVIFIVQ